MNYARENREKIAKNIGELSKSSIDALESIGLSFGNNTITKNDSVGYDNPNSQKSFNQKHKNKPQ